MVTTGDLCKRAPLVMKSRQWLANEASDFVCPCVCVWKNITQNVTKRTPHYGTFKLVKNTYVRTWGVKTINEIRVLMTNDSKTHHPNLVTCYQLVQSILKIGTALAERMG